ncbi:MAG TPA: type II secretion system F family protein [Acidimicrobiales bacterium]
MTGEIGRERPAGRRRWPAGERRSLRLAGGARRSLRLAGGARPASGDEAGARRSWAGPVVRPATGTQRSPGGRAGFRRSVGLSGRRPSSGAVGRAWPASPGRAHEADGSSAGPVLASPVGLRRRWLAGRFRSLTAAGPEWVAAWPSPTPSGQRVLQVVAVAVLAVVVSPVVAVGAVGCLVWWWRRQRAQEWDRRQQQLPEALERMAGALRSGSSLAQALGEASRAVPPPLGVELAGMARLAGRGRPVAEVVDDWAAAQGDPGSRLVASAVALAHTVGAVPARALDGVAATLRERLEAAGERRVLATQARISAVVLGLAPVVFAVFLAVTDPAVAGFLTGSAVGLLCLGGGLALDVLGLAWMTHLTRAAER